MTLNKKLFYFFCLILVTIEILFYIEDLNYKISLNGYSLLEYYNFLNLKENFQINEIGSLNAYSKVAIFYPEIYIMHLLDDENKIFIIYFHVFFSKLILLISLVKISKIFVEDFFSKFLIVFLGFNSSYFGSNYGNFSSGIGNSSSDLYYELSYSLILLSIYFCHKHKKIFFSICMLLNIFTHLIFSTLSLYFYLLYNLINKTFDRKDLFVVIFFSFFYLVYFQLISEENLNVSISKDLWIFLTKSFSFHFYVETLPFKIIVVPQLISCALSILILIKCKDNLIKNYAKFIIFTFLISSSILWFNSIINKQLIYLLCLQRISMLVTIFQIILIIKIVNFKNVTIERDYLLIFIKLFILLNLILNEQPFNFLLLINFSVLIYYKEIKKLRFFVVFYLFFVSIFYFFSYQSLSVVGYSDSSFIIKDYTKLLDNQFFPIYISALFWIAVLSFKNMVILKIIFLIFLNFNTLNNAKFQVQKKEYINDFIAAQIWAKQNTVIGSRFLFDPGKNFRGWRTISQRSYSGSIREWFYSDILYNSRNVNLENKLLISQLLGVDIISKFKEEKYLSRNIGIKYSNNFYKLSENELIKLMKLLEANYVVLEKSKRKLSVSILKAVYENKNFLILYKKT